MEFDQLTFHWFTRFGADYIEHITNESGRSLDFLLQTEKHSLEAKINLIKHIKWLNLWICTIETLHSCSSMLCLNINFMNDTLRTWTQEGGEIIRPYRISFTLKIIKGELIKRDVWNRRQHQNKQIYKADVNINPFHIKLYYSICRLHIYCITQS